ncbi:3-oxoacyl-ACP reductase FabG [Herbiconiux sp. UC225_62]|uniref:3-oxoacyl-ACP reductase FabG n=1 Tax=Herbiconiux sp. UC225_62 TaxID=3350168 RepID=UPI0036D2A21B
MTEGERLSTPHPSGSPRIALVTGAARGIGASIALRLAQDGHAVAVLDLKAAECTETVRTIVAGGGIALAVGADVTSEDEVAQAFAAIEAELGSPTVLVNNAGIIRDNLLFRMTVDDWDQVMGVHLRGAFLMSRAAQHSMTRQGFGRIVNLSSTSSLGNRGQANYAAAKAGILGFTRTLALELGRFGVTVNGVAPGYIQTEMTRVTAERLGVPYEDMLQQWAARASVGRMGQPADVANAVSFFASEESGFVSGQMLYVAGGPALEL